MKTLFVLASLLAANLLLSATFLWLVARLVRACRSTYLRALASVTAIWLAGIVGLFLANALPDLLNKGDESLAMFIWMGICAGQMILACVIVRRLIGTTLSRAFLAYLVVTIS